jgi:hypothetical protein
MCFGWCYTLPVRRLLFPGPASSANLIPGPAYADPEPVMMVDPDHTPTRINADSFSALHTPQR